jgi:hypothetical protein
VFGGYDGSAPLIKAASYLPKESAEPILKAGANVNNTDEEGDTALISAAYRGDRDCVEYLLSEGADIMHSNKAGLNAIQTASRYMEEECLQPLVERESAILTAIKVAMESGNSAVADAVQSVKFVKQQADLRRGSIDSFVANDDAGPLPFIPQSSEDGPSVNGEPEKPTEVDEPWSTGLNSVFGRPSSPNESQRNEAPPPTAPIKNNHLKNIEPLARQSSWFQDVSLIIARNQQTQETLQLDTPSKEMTPKSLQIKRKPAPNFGAPSPASSPARTYQQESPTPQIAPPVPPRAPLVKSSSYNPQPTKPQYQAWSPDQSPHINARQATPPQRTQFQKPPPERQPAPLHSYAPYDPQPFPSSAAYRSSFSPLRNQSAFRMGNPYDDEGGIAENGNRYVFAFRVTG